MYRRTALRVSCCYRTVSHEAAAIVSSMPPLPLLAEERTSMYGGTDRETARELLMLKWQTNWANAANGRWTNRLIGEVRPWFNRRHGEVTFHLSQMLTGHGCFNYYLHRFGKSPTNECSQCDISPDDANHAIFECDAWWRLRREACVYLDIDDLTPDNIVGVMLSSQEAWQRIDNLISRIMSTREDLERIREQGQIG